MTTIRPLIHLVRTSHVHILRQLQLEEALLRADDRSVAIITEGSPPAIVMGVSGGQLDRIAIHPSSFACILPADVCADADVLLHKGNVLQDGVDVVRRFSGGGTVPSHRLLPDDLDVLVAPACHHDASGRRHARDQIAYARDPCRIASTAKHRSLRDPCRFLSTAKHCS